MAKTTKTSKIVSTNTDPNVEVLKKVENGESVVSGNITVVDAFNSWHNYGKSDCSIEFIDDLINNKIIVAENILKESISILSTALKTELTRYNEIRNTHNNFERKKHILMADIIDNSIN